jgi:hypothetical protein
MVHTRREFLQQSCTSLLLQTSACRFYIDGIAKKTPAEGGLYLDEQGLIVQRDGDGGDTAQREGWMWLGIFVHERVLKIPWKLKPHLTFSRTLDLIEVKGTGEFIRNPQKYNDPKDFSRDQTVPLIASMGVWNQQARLDRVWESFERRGRQFQNGDLSTPELLNLFARARRKPIDPTGDDQLWADAVDRGLLNRNPNNTGDDLNMIVILLAGLLLSSPSPTERVKQAVKVYAKNRPISWGCYLGSYRAKYNIDYAVGEPEMIERCRHGVDSERWQVDCPRVLGALRWYFRAESKGNPALAELYEPIVQKYFI